MQNLVQIQEQLNKFEARSVLQRRNLPGKITLNISARMEQQTNRIRNYVRSCRPIYKNLEELSSKIVTDFNRIQKTLFTIGRSQVARNTWPGFPRRGRQ